MSTDDDDEWDPGDLPESQQRLVDDLKAAGGESELIRRTRAGVYHDTASALAAPKLSLVAELNERGLDDLAECAKRGRYDP